MLDHLDLDAAENFRGSLDTDLEGMEGKSMNVEPFLNAKVGAMHAIE